MHTECIGCCPTKQLGGREGIQGRGQVGQEVVQQIEITDVRRKPGSQSHLLQTKLAEWDNLMRALRHME